MKKLICLRCGSDKIVKNYNREDFCYNCGYKEIGEQESKECFDLWVLNFDIKDGVGGRPSWDSLWESLKYTL